MRNAGLALATLLGPLACGDAPGGATEATAASTTGSATQASDTGAPPTTGAGPTTSTDASTSAGAETSTTAATTSTTGDTGEGSSSETGADATTGAPIECPPDALGPGDHIIAVVHGGLPRSALVHVPPGLDPQAAAPLVLNFHGFTMTGAQQAAFSLMNPVADAEGFVVAYPDGVQTSWNAGTCCGGAQAAGINDVGFTRALVAELRTRICLDPARVYATGMSNGGFMAHRLACEASDLVAAIAPVSSVNGAEPCAPERPVPVLMFNGTTDALVPYLGGGAFGSVAETFADWGDRDGCDGAPISDAPVGAASRERYAICDADVEVIQWTLAGMGHCWPGAIVCPYGVSSLDVDANAEMWAFFSQYTLP